MNNYLSTGEMAELCHVSKRTLQYYHEIGLLEPGYLNHANGYRYYTFEQCSHLNFILYMKELGYSLDNIKHIICTQDSVELNTALKEIEHKLLHQQQEITRNLFTLKTIQNNLHLYHHLPQLGKLSIQYEPQRRIIVYENHAFDSHPTSCEKDYVDLWYKIMYGFRAWMIENNIPLSMFHHINGLIRKDHLLQNSLRFTSAWIFVDDSFDLTPTEIMPDGYYLTIFCNSIRKQDVLSERDAMHFMLDEIKRRNLEITGDYYGQEIVSSPVMGYCNNHWLIKAQIPVRFSEKSDLSDLPIIE